MPKAKTPKSPAAEPVDELDFEQALAALEELVGRLESGDQPLERSLADFERGVALTRRCQAALRDAEQKVEILSRDSAAGKLEPFEPEQ
ncbi:MAG TPA: exodeoxyribonuclease VII small subunit [Gammaproteobacteria bacterium]|nr:exodeoxyribonuclease VII small subunit [Gammaproteobacteria bacterium]